MHPAIPFLCESDLNPTKLLVGMNSDLHKTTIQRFSQCQLNETPINPFEKIECVKENLL